MAIRRNSLPCGALATLAALLVGCASADAAREVELPPQTLTDAPTSTAEEERALVTPRRDAEPTTAVEEGEAAAPEAAAPSEQRSDERRQTVVIESASTTEVTPRTLYEASSDERRRRAGAEAPIAVITNSNLAEQAAGGQLTVLGASADGTSTGAGRSGGAAGAVTNGAGGAATTASPASTVSGAATSGGAASGASPAPAATAALTEEYWRGQALTLRLDWKAAIERVDELENEVQELRRRFYEEDDPFYRDNQIKPAWDRALDTLSAARTAAEEHERRLGRFLEEGRRSGALPGWLREGIEFEPPATPVDAPADRRRELDPWEPRVLEEEPRDP